MPERACTNEQTLYTLNVVSFFFFSQYANHSDVNLFQVQNLLQQMQDKFQNMSDGIITRNILCQMLNLLIANLHCQYSVIGKSILLIQEHPGVGDAYK